MSTSDDGRSRLCWELPLAVIAAASLTIIFEPRDPAMSELAIHPIWVVAAIFAARYGVRGLSSIPLLASALLTAELLACGSGDGTLGRSSRVGDLALLVVTVSLAFIGAAHVRRSARLAGELRVAEARIARAQSEIDTLGETALALRDRSDRIATSLAFLVDVAQRFHATDPVTVGQAALELAMARSGAAAGFIQLSDKHDRLRTLTSRGVWAEKSFRPPAVFRDLTAAAAVARGSIVAAHEVPGVTSEDSDLVAPLITEQGIVGVLALRRVPYESLAAVREDVVQVARWASLRLAGSQYMPVYGVNHGAG